MMNGMGRKKNTPGVRARFCSPREIQGLSSRSHPHQRCLLRIEYPSKARVAHAIRCSSYWLRPARHTFTDRTEKFLVSASLPWVCVRLHALVISLFAIHYLPLLPMYALLVVCGPREIDWWTERTALRLQSRLGDQLRGIWPSLSR